MQNRYFSIPPAALALLAVVPLTAQAQTGGVGIGTSAPDASAALEISSTSKGLLPPRLSLSQRDAIASPAIGLTIYNTTTGKLNTWNGTSWDSALSATEQPIPGVSATFNFTGAPQTYTVPTGVRSIMVTVAGSYGGYSASYAQGGNGSRVQATLDVTPGEVLTLYVGGAGGNGRSGASASAPGGYNGGGSGYASAGGGGGASDIRRGGTALSNRIVTAGGGGGGGCESAADGGASYWYGSTSGSGSGTAGGQGGYTNAQSGSGYGGTGGYDYSGGGAKGGDGSFGQGGSGSGSSANSPYRSGGGGGGGYYGGGGGGTANPVNYPSTNIGGGGGGGTSYVVATGASAVSIGSNSQNSGFITITPAAQFAAPVLDGSNFVNVPGTWQVSGANVYRAGGNVGIGTATPGAGLHVSTAEKPSVSGASGVYLSGGASGNPNVELRGTNGAVYIDFAHDLSTDFSARLLSNSNGLGFHTGGSNTPRLLIDPTGALTLSSLAGSGTRMLITDANGLLSAQALPGGDNLGNHTATQNLSLGTNLLTGGGSIGLGISSTGTVGIGGAATVGTTLGVGGAATIGGAATVTGAATIGGDATVGGTVGIGTTTPAASAMLDVTSTTKGFLPPRLSLVQRDAIASPAAGLTVYNTSTNKLNTWNGTSWTETLTTTEQPVQYPAQTFSSPGQYTYTVPANIRSLTVTANGAAGAGVQRLYPTPNTSGGAGSQVQATLTVTPGEVLTVVVGGRGAPLNGGFNGGGSGVNNNANYFTSGGGGGASDVRRGAATLADRLLVAAGGGGGGGGGNGGAGGAPNGSTGTDSYNIPGTGATQSSGGNQGGAPGQGGNGGSSTLNGGGGGGGGYYGGGGSGGYGGGGGGSSWVLPTGSTNITMTAGSNGGDGSVTIAPATVAYAAPVLDGSNFINVPGTWSVNGADVYRPTGNVGIGTADPQAGLHLDRPESSSGSALGVLLSGGTSGNPSIELRGNGKTPYIDFVETSGLDYTTRLLSYGGTLNLTYAGAVASKPTYLLNVEGGITATGQVRANGVVLTSDARFKQNVRPIGSALASVLAMRGVRYEWNALGVRHGGTAKAGQVGLLAQEVEKIYPELVSTDKDGYKAVNYAQLTPVLIEALKEQQEQIEALKAEAATAQAKAAQATATLETFEARLRRLEAATGGQAQR
ncbi:tail fiber domain-containing protein [Hymenobacter properus]|uniref:receptor protein-tyrosine kinase n=1 Tax=Hymenobacter properus TaxID=2791026 RepID=A0A931BDD9_9BACT|nr:tail fiber domain-containing protein [Hymenobacter properus]MBF9140237.1 tail fiber domain-containing protein [Hymenobacter properus]MBR7719044.1 tail fiber domain-containing protein [Microvirga sp. SRT04]